MDEFSQRDQLIEELKQQTTPQALNYNLEQAKKPKCSIETTQWVENEIFAADANSAKYSSRAVNHGFIDLSKCKSNNMRKLTSFKPKCS